jgi:zinc protease
MRFVPTFPAAFAASLALGLAMPADAQRQQGTRQNSAISIPVERYTLPNGLTVLLSPNQATPTISVDVWYHVGSKNEQPGRTGFAHLFEHVMFTGSGNVPYGLHDRLTEGVGGNNNGSTTEDRTNYYENIPSNYLESTLWLEADRMGFLLDKLDSAKFVAQRDIVQNERRQGVDNRPYGRDFEIMTIALYPENNPYHWPVVGYMTDLQAAGLEDVKRFFRLYYAPSNATIAIVGDFDPVNAKALVQKYFGDLPKGATITRPAITPPTITSERRLVYEDRVQIPRLYMMWPTPGMKHDDTYALNVLAQIMTGSRTARLTKALVYDKQSAASVGMFSAPSEQAGRFLLQIVPRPNNTLDQIEATTDSVIARFKQEGPTADELARALAGIEFQFVNGLQSNLGKAEILINGSVFFDNPAQYRTRYTKMKAVTAADVKRVANTYLGPGRIVLSMVPEGKVSLAAKAASSKKVTVAPDGSHYNIER